MIEIDETHVVTLPTPPGTDASGTVRPMEGYGPETYGDAFADVYDDWYRGVSDIDTTVAFLGELAGDGATLELGVGTGRLAIPLARTGRKVTGVDTSAAMLARLHAADADGRIETIHGDMVTDLPDGPFALVFVAYNTIFNLTADGSQQACFHAVATRLAPGGRFAVEAFVPDEPPRRGDDVSVRTLAADRVVLSISRHDPSTQVAEGQFVELSEAAGVRLRPWSIRYTTPDQLDAMAAAAGLELEARHEDAGRTPFDPETSPRHLSVYRRPDRPG